MSSTDIVIAGGGVVGSAIAYFLSRDTDYSITLIDQKKPGNASRASAGGLWPIGESVGLGCGVIFFKTMSKQFQESGNKQSIPQRPHQLPRHFFDFSLKSNEMFPALWRELRENHGMDFKLEKTGLKFVIYDEYDMMYARQIAESIPHLSDQLRWYDQEELRTDEPNIADEAIAALEFTRDDQVNPYRLVEAFTEGARRQGVKILSNTPVQDVVSFGNKITGVKTPHGLMGCDLFINAAGSWASEIAEMAIGRSLPIMPVKGQIVLSERLPSIMRSCVSTSDCYIAQKDNGEILIGSTTEECGFDTTCTFDKLQELAQGARRCFPVLSNCSIKRTWAGLRPATPDEVPILGPVDNIDNYLNACGHFRTGILTSAITGEIISALVRKVEPSVDLTPYLMSRFGENSDWSFRGQLETEALVESKAVVNE